MRFGSLSFSSRPAPSPKAAPSYRPWTIHISGVPHEDPRSLEEELRLMCRGQQPQIQTITCHSLLVGRATVSVLTSLSDEELADVLLALDMARRPCRAYYYSAKFEGFLPLCASGAQGEVDVIAVTGMGGHAIGSWKSPNKDSSEVWIRDFFREDKLKVRSFTYGYDCGLQGNVLEVTLEILGHLFLTQLLAHIRRWPHRPIIFIAHSFGGLMIKAALNRAKTDYPDEHKYLLKAVQGFLFFGVPNEGLRNESLRVLVNGQPNEFFVDQVVVDDSGCAPKCLFAQASMFTASFGRDPSRIVNFYETLPSSTVELDRNGKGRLTGSKKIVVTKSSATAASSGEETAYPSPRITDLLSNSAAERTPTISL